MAFVEAASIPTRMINRVSGHPLVLLIKKGTASVMDGLPVVY
jgi:hypothetical protein